MAGTSQVHLFEQTLLANLAKRQGLFGVQLLAGPPTAGQSMLGEFIMLGNSTATQVWKTFPYNAPTSRDETAQIDLLINVVQALNADHSAVTARAFALLAEVEDELRTTPQQVINTPTPYFLWGEVSSSQRVEKSMNQQSGWRETLIISAIKIRSRI